MKPSTFFERYREIIAGGIMFAIAGIYIHGIQSIRIRSQVRVTARLIPEILGALVVILAIIQTIRGVKYLLDLRRSNAKKNVPAAFISREERSSLWPIAQTFVI
ncbi:MAG: hypothetical protein LBU23_11305, partial [Planctomycetota bacterium]|nr:hypothetical protein [Planctomycetota bacterium]